MAKPTPKNVLVPALILTAICIVISGLLGLTNHITSEKIAQQAREEQILAMSQIFGDEGTEFADKTAKDKNGNEFNYAVATISGKPIGYVFTTSNNGYGGEVQVMTGINVDGTVKSIQILSVADETPGLGQNAKSPDFLEQFKGKSGEISTQKNKDVDALTGATITTNAVIGDVNRAFELFKEVAENGK